jgi:hypothetical protein
MRKSPGPPMDRLRDYVHFAQRNRTNSLIELNNSDRPGNTFMPRRVPSPARIEMRLLSTLVVTCALCQTAIAQTPDCKSIADSSARLACYDKGMPASTAARPAGRAAPAPRTDNSKYIDTISAEDAIMNERIKGICRGC